MYCCLFYKTLSSFEHDHGQSKLAQKCETKSTAEISENLSNTHTTPLPGPTPPFLALYAKQARGQK